MPAYLSPQASTRTHPIATHHRYAVRENWGGPCGAASQVRPGHEYILVIGDYITRYPEVLRKATSKSIARELVLRFSHVGIPKELLTDQGTPLISKLMKDLCSLLQVHHLCTSDGDRDWDLLLLSRHSRGHQDLPAANHKKQVRALVWQGTPDDSWLTSPL